MTRKNKMKPKKLEPIPKYPSEIMKRSTTRIIRKTESNTPNYFQNCSDMYREYLHSLDDCFGIYFVLEKKFFDSYLTDKKGFGMFDDWIRETTTNALSQIDMITHIQNLVMKTNMSFIKTYDTFLHFMLDYYDVVVPEAGWIKKSISADQKNEH